MTKTLAILFVLLILILTIIVDSIWVPTAANSAIQKASSTTLNLPAPLISDTLLGVILGGIIGFLSSIGADTIKDWRTRPILSISEDTTEVGLSSSERRVSIGGSEFPTMIEDAAVLGDIRNRNYADFVADSREYHNNLIGTRIEVRNRGKTAAEQCKASLLLRGTEIRIAWMISKDDFTVTLNADDIEYIDLCMIPVLPRASMYDGTRYFTSERAGLHTSQPGLKPRDLGTGLIEAKLKVSAKNAKQCVKNIWITDIINEEVKFVFFKPNFYQFGFDHGRLFGIQASYFRNRFVNTTLSYKDTPYAYSVYPNAPDSIKGYVDGYKQGNDEGLDKKQRGDLPSSSNIPPPVP